MTIPSTRNTKIPERVNRKIDKIIHRITHSPKKQNQDNEPQLISITPANNMSPNTELISIIPAHQSTPVEPQIHITATTTQVNPKDNIENNNQQTNHQSTSTQTYQPEITNWHSKQQKIQTRTLNPTSTQNTTTYRKSGKTSTNPLKQSIWKKITTSPRRLVQSPH